MRKFEPLTEAQLKQSEDWADLNATPYPVGQYLATIAEAKVDTERLDTLEKLVMDGAEVAIDDYDRPKLYVFIQKEGCGGAEYVYRGEGDTPLRAAIDKARDAPPKT